MGTIDFYATVAAAAGHRLPARCDGKNLLPFLVGDLHGDAHEYLFWHNADPTDASTKYLCSAMETVEINQGGRRMGPL